MAPDLDNFLRPLAIDSRSVLGLSHGLASTFTRLAAESPDQFLPTPISESMLRPARRIPGRFLAIDIGGTNLRVGFVELFSHGPEPLCVLLEEREPIEEHLKSDDPESLFSWIGRHIARTVRRACSEFAVPRDHELPMGVTFSFPMQQPSLAEAVLMPMGKGFALKADLDLAAHLVAGYDKHRAADLPPIRVAAIANDSVATLVSFSYQLPARDPGIRRRPAMALIVGTGCNATLPLRLSSLAPNKRPASVSVVRGIDDSSSDRRIVVNTEWSINGSAAPLRDLGLITTWDEILDHGGERPGFQPLEYMTAGRYLGELARLIFIDYYSRTSGKTPEDVVLTLPTPLRHRFGLSTFFLSHFRPDSKRGSLVQQLDEEFPTEENEGTNHFHWTPELADVLYRIAKAVEVRAAGIIAAATLGLLRSTGELPPPLSSIDGDVNRTEEEEELAVGYTGGCIQHFLDYLDDTQRFIDEALRLEHAAVSGGRAAPRVVLVPCHDGGLTGAGILVPAALAIRRNVLTDYSHFVDVMAVLPADELHHPMATTRASAQSRLTPLQDQRQVSRSVTAPCISCYSPAPYRRLKN
ncbi:hypothetical protein VTJ49DRAFT_2122 [Mycothermus thermophilus]|uniref:Phosphotransferase n=1 Tax=Humicola insolens TaxID=85995 RepID=A0ABR3VNB5_HUMIN